MLIHYGYIHTWKVTPISWFSKRQKSVSLSTLEVELFGLVEVYNELWMRKKPENFEINVNSVLIYEDNKCVISTTAGTEDHYISKYIGFRKNFIPGITSTILCFLFYIKCEFNIADMTTKSLIKI